MSTDGKTFLTVIGPESVMQALAAETPPDGVTIGKPQPLDAMADAVDAPLGPDEIKMLMEFATIGLALGAAVIDFLDKLKTLLAKSEDDKARIIIVDGRTNAEIASVTKDTDPAQAAEAIAAASRQ